MQTGTTMMSCPSARTNLCLYLRNRSSVPKQMCAPQRASASKEAAAYRRLRASAWVGQARLFNAAKAVGSRDPSIRRQTWTPYSRPRKMLESARPHPKSSARIPGRRALSWHNLSV
jgi:hypothetical protein